MWYLIAALDPVQAPGFQEGQVPSLLVRDLQAQTVRHWVSDVWVGQGFGEMGSGHLVPVTYVVTSSEFIECPLCARPRYSPGTQ